MKYIFIDTDNGGTPSNATADTSTSKYHTSSAWPANGARWSGMNAALNDADIRAITDDITVYAQGSADDTTGVTGLSSLTCASLTVIGNVVSPAWDGTKYTLSMTTGTASCFSSNLNVNTTLKNFQLTNTGTNTAPRALQMAQTSAVTILIDGIHARIGGSGTSTGHAILFSQAVAHTATVQNTTVQQVGSPGGTRSGITFSASNTAKAYNCVAEGFSGAGISNGDTTKNCASFNNADDFSGGTMSYCASDDGDGTNAQTSVTWASEFVDYANGDFTLKSGGTKLQGTGIGPGSDANVPTTDITGGTRSGSTTDIGIALFVDSGASITDVDTDNDIYPGQTGITVHGSGLTSGTAARVTTGTKTLSMTSYSGSATAPTFSYPSLSSSLSGGIKFGTATFEITG